ncbi:MAG: O-antigen ligase family protein, partial [Actinomycetota bacterium]|nr:O-antigen ligase family protein [Actinomycetota bacterium]
MHRNGTELVASLVEPFVGGSARLVTASLATVATVTPDIRMPATPAPLQRAPRRVIGGAWPLFVLFPMLPVWWALGVSGLVLSLCALPLLAAVILRRRMLVPRGFGLYLLFLLWCVFSATQLQTARQTFSAAYRGSMYLAAGLLFLYVLNMPRDRLSPDRAVRIMASFFVITVVGGVVGMIVPNITFTTLARGFVPPHLLTDSFVSDLVSASTSSGRAFAAYPIYRPKAPFIYANEWGAAYAMSLPFALCAIAKARTKLARDALVVTALISVFPLVFSLNRGAWLSATAGVLYATVRLARGRNSQFLRVTAAVSLLLGAVLFVTPLGEIVVARLQNGYGDAHRAQLYGESIDLVRASPVFGYGAPVLIEGNLSAGTHGQLWTIVVSQGIPGLLFFTGWLLWALWRG